MLPLYNDCRRLQAAEQLSALQQHFNELAQEVQQHTERAKQCSAANATCLAYDGAANQKVRHAAVLEMRSQLKHSVQHKQQLLVTGAVGVGMYAACRDIPEHCSPVPRQLTLQLTRLTDSFTSLLSVCWAKSSDCIAAIAAAVQAIYCLKLEQQAAQLDSYMGSRSYGRLHPRYKLSC